MMYQFSVLPTMYGPCLTIVDTSRYDAFLGFRRIVTYLNAPRRGDVCVMRAVNGQDVALRIDPQSRYREWVGCFSYLEDVTP